MSKWKQISKTRRIREMKNPATRLAKITELKRMIKVAKIMLPDLKKQAENLERSARWARFEAEAQKRSIEQFEKELIELENYNKTKG